MIKADGGYIPVTDVDVYGPGQKAIIAWNGTLESIILSEDVYSSGTSMVLKIIPLPSNPLYIEEGDVETFTKISYPVSPYWFGGTQTLLGSRSYEIIFHEKIKSHDITVVRVDNATQFIDEAENFLTLLGYETSVSIEGLEDLVNQYVGNDVNYFVFDIIELTPEVKSVEPIIYTFECDHLYYPMVISSLAEGDTDITLFVITDAPLNYEEFPPNLDYGHVIYNLYDYKITTGTVSTTTFRQVLQAMQAELPHDTLEFIFSDIENRSSQIPTYFEGDTWLSVLVYEGSLKSLTSDLKVNTLSEWSTITHEITTTYETTYDTMTYNITQTMDEIIVIPELSQTVSILFIVLLCSLFFLKRNKLL